MRLTINLAQSNYIKRQPQYRLYLPLAVLLLITFVGNYLWYHSINSDMARYREKLNKIVEGSLTSKPVSEESVSQKEKEVLIKEAVFINNIIKSKSLSWSGFLAHLEKEIIPNISLVSLTPKVVEDKVRIDVKGVGRDLKTITRFMDKLERSPAFQGVFLSRSSDADVNGERLVNFIMELEYICI